MGESGNDVELAEVSKGFLDDSNRGPGHCFLVPLNQSRETWKWCVFWLVAAFAASAAVLPYGISRIYLPHSTTFSLVQANPILSEVVPLILNLGVTILTEPLGLIHATGLRWNLMRENRLEFNANLRLLTASRRFTANSWYCNLLSMILLTLCYTSSSLVLVTSFDSDKSNGLQDSGSGVRSDLDTISISGMALITLACGLLGQSAIALWVLRSTDVPTWSSSPIDTALVCCQKGASRQHARTMQSVGDSPSPIPARPFVTQKSAYAAHKHIRRVLWVLWALVAFGVVWTVTATAGAYIKVDGCSTCGRYTGSGWWPVPGVGGPSPFVVISIVSEHDPVGPVILIIVFALQASVTLGLHCAELLINVSRDEDTWRRTYQPSGYDSKDYGSISAAAKSWKTLVLFALKPVIHWLYGLGNACYAGGPLIMRPAQLMWMTLTFLVLAIFGTSIARYRRTGPQPVTYGHLQTVIDLVDDWHEELHWGHKSEDSGGVCHAGTSNESLAPIKMDQDYI